MPPGDGLPAYEHAELIVDGARGLATELLTRLLDADAAPTYLYSCGPMPMLRAVGEIATARRVPCQLSIETSMPCGIGLCQGCGELVCAGCVDPESALDPGCPACSSLVPQGGVR